MKKFLHVFLLFFSVMAFAQEEEIPSTLPFIDNFDYVVGRGLLDSDSWYRINGNEGEDIKVVNSPNWTIPNITPPRGNAVSATGSGLNAMVKFDRNNQAPIYSSFLFKLTDLGLLNERTPVNIFAYALLNSSESTVFNSRVMIKANDAGTGYNLGVTNGSSSNEPEWVDEDYAIDQELFIVYKKTSVSEDPAEMFSSLYINPDPTAAEPADPSIVNETTRFGTPSRFIILQDALETPTMIIDELKISETWASVVLNTPSTLEVAEIATYPNPVSNGILFVNAKTNIALEIYSVLGKKVLEKSNVSTSVDVSNLAKGCYILKMRDANNAVQTKKLIIQ